jgi:hypothetical protein
LEDRGAKKVSEVAAMMRAGASQTSR